MTMTTPTHANFGSVDEATAAGWVFANDRHLEHYRNHEIVVRNKLVTITRGLAYEYPGAPTFGPAGFVCLPADKPWGPVTHQFVSAYPPGVLAQARAEARAAIDLALERKTPDITINRERLTFTVSRNVWNGKWYVDLNNDHPWPRRLKRGPYVTSDVAIERIRSQVSYLDIDNWYLDTEKRRMDEFGHTD